MVNKKMKIIGWMIIMAGCIGIFHLGLVGITNKAIPLGEIVMAYGVIFLASLLVFIFMNHIANNMGEGGYY